MKLRKNSLVTPLFAWNDILQSLLLAFLVLIAVQNNQDAPLQTKAGAISVYTEWEHGKDLDVDVWIQYPSCTKPLFYNRLQCTNGWIARDDRGIADSNTNSENASLYDLVGGEYGVNIHAFRQGRGDEFPAWVHVTIAHRADSGMVTNIFDGQIYLSKLNEEVTVMRWTMDETGEILNKTTIYKRLVEKESLEGTGMAQ